MSVKANPAREVLQRLADLGSGFDVASPGEIDRCLKLGIDPARLATGNTVAIEGRPGYCPQTVILDEALTVGQHVQYFQAAYGISSPARPKS